MSDRSEFDARILEELYALVEARKDADPAESYTAKLYARGPEQIAKKLGEEAVETVIEAVRHDREALAAESADLLYHLVVLWAARGLSPDEVWEKLAARRGVSGLIEKAGRGDKSDG